MSQNTDMVHCEVAWKDAKTFDVFSTLWKVQGQPLAGQRRDIQGYRYNQCIVPFKKVVRLSKSLSKLEKDAKVYIVNDT